MAIALEQARGAAELGEVPVGAVVVWQGQVIATGKNSSVHDHDPTAHAEILAMRSAAQVLGNYRLDECELFVTLEPCAMCSGAILNARLKRVVFGAAEPKTGAAGSVLNLFALPQLNHHTQLLGGVLAQPSLLLLQDFFHQRRAERRTAAMQRFPLRDDSLRTPDAAFTGLSVYPWASHYRNDLAALEGLRMHYLDESTNSLDSVEVHSSHTYLCVHGRTAWSYQFHKSIAGWLQAGHSVVAPDLVGFGKSDKPKKEDFHTLGRHCKILSELVEILDLKNIVLVLPGRNDLVHLLGLTLPEHAPLRYRSLLAIDAEGVIQGRAASLSDGWQLWADTMESFNNQVIAFHSGCNISTQSDLEIIQALDAPFPKEGYRAGIRAFAKSLKLLDSPESIEMLSRTHQFWQMQRKI